MLHEAKTGWKTIFTPTTGCIWELGVRLSKGEARIYLFPEAHEQNRLRPDHERSDTVRNGIKDQW